MLWNDDFLVMWIYGLWNVAPQFYKMMGMGRLECCIWLWICLCFPDQPGTVLSYFYVLAPRGSHCCNLGLNYNAMVPSLPSSPIHCQHHSQSLFLGDGLSLRCPGLSHCLPISWGQGTYYLHPTWTWFSSTQCTYILQMLCMNIVWFIF
jgi:hypothetical protein